MVLIEYCYQAHLAGCPFCPLNLGEVEFLSRTEILQVLSEETDTNQEHCECIMIMIGKFPIIILYDTAKPDDSNVNDDHTVTYPDLNSLSTSFNITTSTDSVDKYFLIIVIGKLLMKI